MIVIVGAGALGSHAALFLRHAAKLRLVDFDRVETRNTRSQFHAQASVGRNKTEALRQSLQFLFGVDVEAVPHRLTELNVERLLARATLVLDCVDHADSRRTIQRFVRMRNMPCLHGALAAAGAQYGRIVWDANFVIDEDSGAATCDDDTALPFIATVAAHLASAAQAFLRDGTRIGYQVHARGSESYRC
jgi:molybdopterin/thiamine biosynthesis adenylyltransferase